MRTKILRRTILSTLEMAEGFALPDQSLRQFVGDLARPQPTDDEWTEHMAWLVKGNHIKAIPSKIDADLVQWAITESGETLLAYLT